MHYINSCLLLPFSLFSAHSQSKEDLGCLWRCSEGVWRDFTRLDYCSLFFHIVVGWYLKSSGKQRCLGHVGETLKIILCSARPLQQNSTIPDWFLFIIDLYLSCVLRVSILCVIGRPFWLVSPSRDGCYIESRIVLPFAGYQILCDWLACEATHRTSINSTRGS